MKRASIKEIEVGEQEFSATGAGKLYIDATAAERAPRVGDIVGYVLEREGDKVTVRPAIVVHNWSDPPWQGTLQLQVFMDGDGGPYNDHLPNVCWRTSVTYDENKAVGTWHWL